MPFDGARYQIDIMAADRTAQAFASVDRRMKSLEQSQSRAAAVMAASTNTFNRAIAATSSALSAAAIAQRVWAAGMKAGDLGEQAEQLGLTIDQLQAYRLLAAQAGVSNEQLDATILKLNRSMGAANEGNDEMIARFQKLGVNLLDAEGKLRGPADVLPELSRGLIKVSSDAERSALMAEFLGKSGARVTTMLQGWAAGNDTLTAAARAQGALVSSETAEAWDKLGDHLKVVNAQLDTFLATIGAPIVVGGMEHVLKVFESTRKEVEAIQKAWEWLTNAGTTSASDLVTRQQTINAQLENLKDSTDALDVAKVAGLRKELAAIAKDLAIMAGDGGAILVGDTQRFTAKPGKSNPTGKAAAKAGETEAARQLRETQKAMDDLFDSIEKVRQASEGVMDRFGDGAAYAARETAELNEMLQMGFLDAGTHARALQDVTKNADDMARAFRGAAGGADAFIAGFEQGLADIARANSAFEMGKQLVDQMADSLTDLATGAEVDFAKILNSFLAMLIQMELRAAASNIFNMISGKGPTNAGIGGFISDWLSGLGGGGGGGGPIAVDGIPTIALAEGGRYEAGVPRITGENGWELDIPDRGGTVLNQRQIAEALGGGGGTTVVLNMTNQIGSVVSRAEMERQLQEVEDRARKGAIAGVLDAKSRGGSYRSGLRR